MVDVGRCSRSKYIDVGRIRRTIDEGPYEAVIVMSPENIPYYSGFYNMDIRFITERFHFVVWPRGGAPAFVVIDRRKETLLPGDTFVTDIVEYHGEELDSVRALAEVLHDRGVAKGTIGIEGRSFPGGHLQELQQQMPDVTFEDAYMLLERVRATKTPAEIELLKHLTQITMDAIDMAFQSAAPGDTERSIAARMQFELLKSGADMIAAPIFGAGDRGGLFHGLATDKVIDSGMLVKTDFGGLLAGYYSDVARTVVMGRASDYQRDMHAKVTEVKHRIVDYIRPGMAASELAQFGRDVYKELGLEYKWAILGHGIGMAIHEQPQIYPWVDDPILPGMVMMIETGYQDYPNESFHVEDLIVITEKGAEYLLDVGRHDQIMEIGV